jgi:hypothetical protein
MMNTLSREIWRKVAIVVVSHLPVAQFVQMTREYLSSRAPPHGAVQLDWRLEGMYLHTDPQTRKGLFAVASRCESRSIFCSIGAWQMYENKTIRWWMLRFT